MAMCNVRNQPPPAISLVSTTESVQCRYEEQLHATSSRARNSCTQRLPLLAFPSNCSMSTAVSPTSSGTLTINNSSYCQTEIHC